MIATLGIAKSPSRKAWLVRGDCAGVRAAVVPIGRGPEYACIVGREFSIASVVKSHADLRRNLASGGGSNPGLLRWLPR